MTWSMAQARRAAAAVRAVELGSQAIATVRAAGITGVFRSRAPLPLLLYVAAQDGLVVDQGDGGYAVLRSPLTEPPLRSGSLRLRLLRRIDRHWELLVLAVPPLVGMGAGAATVPFPAARPGGVIAVLLSLVWVAALMTAQAAGQVGWVARMGSSTRRGRVAESLPGFHWSVPLLHQPDPDRVDELIGLVTDRLHHLIIARAQRPVARTARIEGQATETPVVLVSGISTEATRAAAAGSARAIRGYDGGGEVIVLSAPSRLEEVPTRPSMGGSFLLLYLFAVAVVLAVCARFVADTEAAACASACDGRPSSYGSALRWSLQRLLFTDAPNLSPGTVRIAVLGWLMSALTPMGVLVAFVAGRQEVSRQKELASTHGKELERVVDVTRTLVLLVTADERSAVMQAVRSRTGQDAVPDQSGSRGAYLLGELGGTEILLAQAGEQGVLSAAGTLVSAIRLIRHLRPDHVILTGICYGLRPDQDQRLGDLVVGRRVQGVDHRKATDERTIHRGVNVGCSPVLLDRFQIGQATKTGRVQVHFGTVLTSNTVVNSRQLVGMLRQEFPDAIAGEMEGTGLYEATTEDIKPDWILVKAISDWGYDKDDDLQALAARTAAEFVTHVIAGGALRRRRD